MNLQDYQRCTRVVYFDFTESKKSNIVEYTYLKHLSANDITKVILKYADNGYCFKYADLLHNGYLQRIIYVENGTASIIDWA